MALDMEVGLGPDHIVLDGDPAPLPKKEQSPPNFRPNFIVAKRLDASRCHLRRCLSPGDFVLDGDPAPYPKRGSPLFSAQAYCGQTAAWIKMPLGTEVGLGLRCIVLDEDPAPLPQRDTDPPIFGQRPL